MKFYQELTLLPDADIDPHFLWSKVYLQVHLALVEMQQEDKKSHIGVSFPDYWQNTEKQKRALGKRLRVFAQTEAELERLRLPDFLLRLEDYVHIKRIKPVPAEVTAYAFFSRLSEKANHDALARRRAKRLNIPYAEALAFFADTQNRKQPKREAHLYPFISMQSLGSGEKYPISIVQSESTEGLVFGQGFSTYGLSADSSVPLFK